MKRENIQREFLERVQASQGIVHKVSKMYCHDLQEQKDLVHEILIQLWKSYPSFRGDASFSTWMYKVSLNVAIQSFKREKRRPDSYSVHEKFLDLSVESQEDDFEEKRRHLYLAIDQLNKIEKAIIMLFLEEKSNEEIAEIVGITQNYVRVKMNRIKEKIRKLLNP